MWFFRVINVRFIGNNFIVCIEDGNIVVKFVIWFFKFNLSFFDIFVINLNKLVRKIIFDLK